MSTYVFDETGTLAANKIVNEPHVITAINGVDHFVFKPQATPFYGASLVITNPNNDILTEGVDYQLTHHWQQAADVVGQPIYGTVMLIDPNSVAGTYKLQYQTLGGDYVDTPANLILEGYFNQVAILGIDWSTAPVVFPPTQHTHPVSGLNGMAQIINRLDAIELAIQNGHGDIHIADIVDLGTSINPLLAKLDEVITLLGPGGGVTQQDLQNAMDAQALALVTPTTTQASLGIAKLSTPDEARSINYSTIVTPANLNYALSRTYRIDTVTGTTGGGPDGKTFDSLQSAFAASPNGGQTMITFGEDLYFPTGQLVISNKRILLRGDTSANKIIRSAGNEGGFLLNNTTLNISRVSIEWGESSHALESGQSPFHVGLGSYLRIGAYDSDPLAGPTNITALGTHTQPLVYTSEFSRITISGCVITGNGGGHELIKDSNIPISVYLPGNTLTDIVENFTTGYHNS